MKLSTSWKFWNFFRVQLEFLSGIGQRRLGWKRNGVDTIAVDGDDKVDLFFAGGCTSAHRVWLCLCVEDRGGKDEDEDDRMIAERMKSEKLNEQKNRTHCFFPYKLHVSSVLPY